MPGPKASDSREAGGSETRAIGAHQRRCAASAEAPDAQREQVVAGTPVCGRLESLLQEWRPQPCRRRRWRRTDAGDARPSVSAGQACPRPPRPSANGPPAAARGTPAPRRGRPQLRQREPQHRPRPGPLRVARDMQDSSRGGAWSRPRPAPRWRPHARSPRARVLQEDVEGGGRGDHEPGTPSRKPCFSR